VLQWVAVAIVGIGVGAVIATDPSFSSFFSRTRIRHSEAKLPKPLDKMTAADLAAMPDAELEKLDPLVMNLIVARGLPGLATLEIPSYVATVDDWARQIDEGNRRLEPISKHDPTYLVSREFWMAGGMAVALAGPRFGIRYTSTGLDDRDPAQHFVHGVIDNRMGTCASMPVLHMAIGFRLGWPLKAVVSADHMWSRWDDGKPKEKGGIRFNLEATNSKSDGSWGSFNSPSDEEYASWLHTPRRVIENGSDFTSLTARQTLGVFLQSRAGVWVARDCPDRAISDARLAVACFPKNVDIQRMLAHATGKDRPRWHRGTTVPAFGSRARTVLSGQMRMSTIAVKCEAGSGESSNPRVPTNRPRLHAQ
jgi:hypothetical protein